MKIQFDILLLSSIVAILIFVLFTPELYKYSYGIETIHKSSKKHYTYFHDLDKDGKAENFVLSNLRPPAYIHFTTGTKLQQVNVDNPFLGKSITFGDYDNDGVDELAFLSQKGDSVLLSVLKFRNGKLFFLKKDRFITQISKNFKGNFDTFKPSFHLFTDTNEDGYKDFIFSLLSQYSYQPRGFYSYDIKNDSLNTSAPSGAYFLGPGLADFDSDGKQDIYFSTKATSNFSSNFSNVIYPDTSCWVMAYNLALKPIFEPIKINDFHNVSVQPLKVKDSVYLSVLGTQNKDNTTHELAIYNSRGVKVKSREFNAKEFNKPSMLSNTAPDFDNIYIFDQDGNIYIYNSELELVKKKKLVESKNRENIVYAGYDITGNGKKDLIYLYYNGIIIFEDGLNKVLEINMEYPGFSNPSLFIEEGKRMFHFEIKNKLWYLLSIEESNIYKIRFLLYIMSFIIIYFFILGIKHTWLRKLKQDNINLNKIIQEHTKEIEDKNIKLKKEAEFKEALASMLVHDLKHPLQAILSTMDKGEVANKKLLAAYSNQMLSLVLNILDVQKYENSKINLNITENSISSCTNLAVEKMKIFAKQKNICIKNKTDVETCIKFDFESVERVLINLLSNAVKFSPHNSTIIINSGVSQMGNSRYFFVSVKDSGKGIQKEFQDSIFEKFNSEKQVGHSYATGLGLNYCKIIAEAHDGSIKVYSTFLKGATFSFHLPISEKQKIKTGDSHNPEELHSSDHTNFTSKDFIELSSYSALFKGIPFYEITELYEVLAKIDTQSSNIQKWKNRLKEAIDYGNEGLFNQLLTTKNV